MEKIYQFYKISPSYGLILFLKHGSEHIGISSINTVLKKLTRLFEPIGNDGVVTRQQSWYIVENWRKNTLVDVCG